VAVEKKNKVKTWWQWRWQWKKNLVGVRISKKNWLAVEKKFGILVVRVGSCAGHDLLGGESR
jgi:hypothetical protein